jgi:hypothetical protein
LRSLPIRNHPLQGSLVSRASVIGLTQ